MLQKKQASLNNLLHGGVKYYNCCDDHSLLMNMGNSGETVIAEDLSFVLFFFTSILSLGDQNTCVRERPSQQSSEHLCQQPLWRWGGYTHADHWQSRGNTPLDGGVLATLLRHEWVHERSHTRHHHLSVGICSVDVITKVNAIIFRPMETVLRWPDENRIAVTAETGSCCIKTRLTLSWNGWVSHRCSLSRRANKMMFSPTYVRGR